MRALETKSENKKAVAEFRKKLSEIAYNLEDCEWGFPNGVRDIYPTYYIHTYLGDIQIGVPKSWTTRVPHLIRFEKPQGSPSPDVEINIPVDHDRKISGLYVQLGQDYLLCSRGSFNAFRGQIKRDVALSYFDKWVIEIDDSDNSANVIPVCSLSSPTIANDIATFAKAVLKLKDLHKAGKMSPKSTLIDSSNNPWTNSREFEGTKTGGSSKSIDYDYLHGPICNQLFDYLEEYISNKKAVYVVKNKHIDAAIADKTSQKAIFIFEVKTATLPSSQIYSAIGQLRYYQYLYGDNETKLFVVLPSNCKSIETEKFIESLGFIIAYENSGKFQFSNGKELSIIV